MSAIRPKAIPSVQHRMAGGAEPRSRSIAYTWGSTAAERRRSYPCDRYLADPDDVCFRAIDIAAPARVAFRWLCQLKVAPYSYDWIDNLGRTSPRQLTPGLEALEIGQMFMGSFELVEFERDRHFTARLLVPRRMKFIGEIAVSYVVTARGPSRSRLFVKLLVRYPTGPLGWLMRWLLPWGDLVMMRKQFLTLKDLAETTGGHPA